MLLGHLGQLVYPALLANILLTAKSEKNTRFYYRIHNIELGQMYDNNLVDDGQLLHLPILKSHI